MDLQQLLQMGARAFASGIGGAEGRGLSMDSIMHALAKLLPGDGEQIDLAALVGKMQGGGFATLAQSWLGDGGNAGIDASQLIQIFGGDRIGRFADELGIDQDTAMQGLGEAVPEMVDQASSGGALKSLGGLSGLAGMAGKLFG